MGYLNLYLHHQIGSLLLNVINVVSFTLRKQAHKEGNKKKKHKAIEFITKHNFISHSYSRLIKLMLHAKKHFSFYPKTHRYGAWISHLAVEDPAEPSSKRVTSLSEHQPELQLVAVMEETVLSVQLWV